MNKKWWWVIGGAIVLVIILAVVLRPGKKAVAPVEQASSTQDLETSVLQSTEDFSKGSVRVAETGAVTPAALSYAQALSMYATERIQFDTKCQAFPPAQTWKNGTDVMLDNRAGEDRVFHLGSLGDISVKAWGFKIVQFKTETVPSTILIDCGTSQNVATVLLQK